MEVSTFEQIGAGESPTIQELLFIGSVAGQPACTAENVECGQRMLTTRVDKTILVVEDDLDVRALVRIFLERAGYAVVTADDGEDGLRVYKKHQSSIVLLLTDMKMPKMNGKDLADRVLQLDSHLPVLFMSGSGPLAGLRSGCLAKPFKSVDLVGRVAQVLGASDHRPAAL